jgi:hypothetical protein
MQQARRDTQHRPRELRRRVIMPARLRSCSGWTDACILNISSRGLLVHSARTGPAGSIVEVWRGDHVIVARVVWHDGARAGLEAEDKLPVDQILSLNASAALILTAGQPQQAGKPPWERRRRDRLSQGRMIEYAGVVVIACSLAVTAFDLVIETLGRPMALINAALGG